MKSILRPLIMLCAVLTVYACSEQPSPNTTVTPSTTTTPQPVLKVNNDSLVMALSKSVLTALKNNDYQTLVTYIHPTQGVRFSPYATIDTTTDVKLSAAELLKAMTSKDKFKWGAYDGTGEPIKLNAKAYFAEFVYNADFLNAEKTSLNKMLGRGNSLNNLEAMYKNCVYTESYFSGFDKQFEGADWCCLRLVFKKQLDKFYLIAIVHDQATM